MAYEPEGDSQAGSLGGYIRLQRQLADLSLRQLSDLTKVSNAYLSQVERGLHQPSLRVLRSIADALNLSADTLLSQAGMAGKENAGGTPGLARDPAPGLDPGPRRQSCAIPTSARKSARRCSACTAACDNPLALDILITLIDM